MIRRVLDCYTIHMDMINGFLVYYEYYLSNIKGMVQFLQSWHCITEKGYGSVLAIMFISCVIL